MAKNDKQNMGKTKRSTDDLINDAINKQNDWLENRREYTRGFLKSLNMFAKKSDKKSEKVSSAKTEKQPGTEKKSRGVLSFWFPMLCVVVCVIIAAWTVFVRPIPQPRIAIVPDVPAPVVKKVVHNIKMPEFDIVRIDKTGHVIIAGRWSPNKNISVVVNGKIIATELTNEYGEFAYSSVRPWEPGNYTIALLGADPEIKSNDKVFVYVSGRGAHNSVSLLMTKDGSTVLQAPSVLYDGDLVVSKIDYLSGGRVVVTGNAFILHRLGFAVFAVGKSNLDF